jgi:hypothetical protein
MHVSMVCALYNVFTCCLSARYSDRWQPCSPSTTAGKWDTDLVMDAIRNSVPPLGSLVWGWITHLRV